jgi:hypothetical protein
MIRGRRVYVVALAVLMNAVFQNGDLTSGAFGLDQRSTVITARSSDVSVSLNNISRPSHQPDAEANTSGMASICWTRLVAIVCSML